MNFQEDAFYQELLEDYFQQRHGTKLFRTFVKLDKKEDYFTMKQTYEETINQFDEELEGILTIIDLEDENLFERDEYLGFIGSGLGGLNPSLIHLGIEDNEEKSIVVMKAYTGEGLIKQNTADKAMKQVKEYFGEVDMENL